MGNSFSSMLSTLRKQRGLTQKQLAISAKISVRTLIYWEKGHCEPRSDELEEVLNALNITPEQRAQTYMLLQSPRGVRMMRNRINDCNENNEPEAHIPHIPDSGDLLAALRLRQGWTREQLAMELGVNKSTVCRWEHTEVLPTEENLIRLFALLNVHPMEQEALLARRLMPSSLDQDGSREAWARCVQTFSSELQSGSLQLVDLHALALKRQLWLPARTDPYFKSLMGTLESHYSFWLIYQGRLVEAETCARRALQLCAADGTVPHGVTGALNIMSACMHTRYKNDPAKIVRMLRYWLPRIEHAPALLALQCDLAYYVALSEDTDSALHLMRQAKQQLFSPLATLETIRYYQISLARIFAIDGQFDRALRNLPDNQGLPEYQHLFPNLVRSEILYSARQLNAARQMAQQLYSDLKRLPSPLIRKRLDQLACQL